MNNKKGSILLQVLSILIILSIIYFITILLVDDFSNKTIEMSAKTDCQSIGLEYVEYDFDNEIVNCRNNTDYIITAHHKIRVIE